MSNDNLAKLKAIDMAVLTDVVRKDQQCPSLQITNWSVHQLSDRGIISPEGLWLFRGSAQAKDSIREWSVVLKILNRPKQEPAQDDLWYWKREILLAQSGLLDQMPGPIKAPRMYRTDEYPDSAWLWMEYIIDGQPGHWTLKQYAFAAYELGRWNGACYLEMPRLNEPWLTRCHYISWIAWMDVERDWRFPLNQAHVSAEIKRRYEQLWEERELFYKVLERLPQVFSHFDCQRRNIFICNDPSGQNKIIAVDWAQCGIGALGAELNSLVSCNGYMLEYPPSDLPNLEEAIFPAYLQGLQEAGWKGEADLIRLGYLAWQSVYFGLIFPGYTAWWCAEENRAFALQIYNIAEEDLFRKFLPLLKFSLDSADTARKFMKVLNIQ